MTDHDEANEALTEQRERASFSAARQHVGAAGFAQRDLLEQIINAGREQILITQSLRQVVTATLTQLRALPRQELTQASQPHVEALEGIISAGRAQMDTAHALRLSIQRALAEVRGTPQEHISARLLSDLSAAVQRQAADLQTIVNTAIGEASTVEQIARLEQVSADAYTALVDLERERAEQELAALAEQGAQALKRIGELEAQGETQEARRAELEQGAQVARERIRELEAQRADDQAELTVLEDQASAHARLIAELEAASARTRTTLEALRRSVQRQARPGARTGLDPHP